jgi:gas vesicle protein
MSRANHAFGYVAAVLGAGALGVMAGLLMAPVSGRETRRKWARRLEEEKKALERKGRRTLDELTDYASRKIDEGKQKLEELVHS